VAVPPVSLAIEGIGQFPSAGGTVTLRAGVRKSLELLNLHAAIGAALAAEGFRREDRPYTPHVTLARLGPDVDSGVVERLLNQHAGFSRPAALVTEFRLYSSTFVGDVPNYRPGRAYRLMRVDSAD
jgi:2'-5' RNA ligase